MNDPLNREVETNPEIPSTPRSEQETSSERMSTTSPRTPDAGSERVSHSSPAPGAAAAQQQDLPPPHDNRPPSPLREKAPPLTPQPAAQRCLADGRGRSTAVAPGSAIAPGDQRPAQLVSEPGTPQRPAQPRRPGTAAPPGTAARPAQRSAGQGRRARPAGGWSATARSPRRTTGRGAEHRCPPARPPGGLLARSGPTGPAWTGRTRPRPPPSQHPTQRAAVLRSGPARRCPIREATHRPVDSRQAGSSRPPADEATPIDPAAAGSPLDGSVPDDWRLRVAGGRRVDIGLPTPDDTSQGESASAGADGWRFVGRRGRAGPDSHRHHTRHRWGIRRGRARAAHHERAASQRAACRSRSRTGVRPCGRRSRPAEPARRRTFRRGRGPPSRPRPTRRLPEPARPTTRPSPRETQADPDATTKPTYLDIPPHRQTS